jgi:hypothetical protein
VDFPTVAPEDHQAALGHGDVLEDWAGPGSSMVGSSGDGPQHHADLALLDEGVGPEAPDAGRRDREVALLGGFELLACLSLMMTRASSAVWVWVSCWFDWGTILPSILMAGGKSAVMKRSDRSSEASASAGRS